MCEIQIIVPFNREVNEEDTKEFFNLLDLGSYGNRDAYGLFTDNYMFRKGIAFYEETDEQKEEIANTIKERGAKFIIGHNRLTTQGSGKINHNNHPFPTDNWVIVHNGVIRNDYDLQYEYDVEYKEDTDSVIIVSLLEKFYQETGDSVEAIKKVAESLSGRFSVCAYNKEEERLFYFKNKSTAFDFRLVRFEDDSEVLIGSTSSANFDDVFVKNYQIFYDLKYKSAFDAEAGHEVIYEIDNSQIKIVGYFKEEKQAINYSTKNYGTNYGYNNYNTSSKKSLNTTGGYYEHDWENWDKEWSNGIDVDYSNPKHAFSGIVNEGDLRFNLVESSEFLWEEIQEAIGFDFELNMELDNNKVLYTIKGSPVTMNEICELLSDLNVCEAEIESHDKIAVYVNDIYEAFK